MSRPGPRATIALVLLVSSTIAGTAAAQSTRYPPPPRDPDAEAEERSEFWERTVAPGLDRFRERVERARRLLDERAPDQIATAEQLLTEAIAILPDAAEGYWYLGVAQELRGRWAECAASYRRVWQLDPSFAPADRSRPRGPLGHALGVCLARAGDLEEAAFHLERLSRLDDASSDTLLRLGEVYMAMGRLHDAIEVLERARRQSTTSAEIHWALAVAYDRARRPAEATALAALARDLDATLVRALSPGVPYLPTGEQHYYEAIAYQAKEDPARTILYFRAFLRMAPHSPWRHRAAEHLRALEAVDLADQLMVQGLAPVDRTAVSAALRSHADALGRCLQRTPEVLLYVRVTQVGPRPRGSSSIAVFSSQQPEPGIRASVFAAFGANDEAVADAVACVEREAARIKFPRVPISHTWWGVTFPVIAR